MVKLFKFFDRAYTKHSVSVYASQATLFILMSSVPFLMILVSLLQYVLPVDKSFVLELIDGILPESIQPIGHSIVTDVFRKQLASLISVTTIVLLWASSKGIMSLMICLDNVNEVTNPINPILRRIKALLYTLVFIAGIILSIILVVFGNSIYDLISANYPSLSSYLALFMHLQYFIPSLVLLLVFWAGYKYLPSKHDKLIPCFPGALISSICWVVFSMIFSFYATNFASYSYVYGSLAFLIVAMLWLYACMNIFLLGAEINLSIYEKKHLITSATGGQVE